MTFNDLFKSSFLSNVTSFSPVDMALSMICALVIGLFVFFVYKKTYAGVMYSSGFGLSLVGLTLVTTLVILAVTSNIILSLGMVGALSIVRFRTAIKEPMDIVFLFWSIAAGIVFGAGLLPLGILGSLFIGIILTIFGSRKVADSPYIFIVSSDNEDQEEAILSELKQSVHKYSIKAKTITERGMELSMEIRLKDGYTKFMGKIKEIEGVNSAALISYNGDYMS